MFDTTIEKPIPMILHCPSCKLQHVDMDDDTGLWATERFHRTHLCLGCGNLFKPSNAYTVGVETLPPHATEIMGSKATMDIAFLAYRSAMIANDHGWWEQNERNMGELLMLATTELAEAFEELRNGNEPELIYHQASGVSFEIQENVWSLPDKIKPEGYLVEIADVFIRLLDTVEHYGLTQRLVQALTLKLAYNQGRPYRHGGKLA